MTTALDLTPFFHSNPIPTFFPLYLFPLYLEVFNVTSVKPTWGRTTISVLKSHHEISFRQLLDLNPTVIWVWLGPVGSSCSYILPSVREEPQLCREWQRVTSLQRRQLSKPAVGVRLKSRISSISSVSARSRSRHPTDQSSTVHTQSTAWLAAAEDQECQSSFSESHGWHGGPGWQLCTQWLEPQLT